jgi:hypothetical protein
MVRLPYKVSVRGFPRSLVALAKFMQLSLLKAAHANLFRRVEEIRVSSKP